MSLTVPTLTADRGDARRRLDLVVRRHLAALTRTAIQRTIRGGQVTVNGVTVRRPATRVAAGDVVGVHLPATDARHKMAPEPLPVHILYEDDDLLVADKQAGIVTHPTYRHDAGTLMNGLLWHARAWPADRRPTLVGRLDRLTTGLVLAAKSAAVHAALQREMTAGRAAKDYLAVVRGRVRVRRGHIDLRLSRDPGDRRKVVASPAIGRPSRTRFERLSQVNAPPRLTLLRCRLITGRTHQIRVHLAARGWPLVGDPVYGGGPWPVRTDSALLGALDSFRRQALHAWRLTIRHPVTGSVLRLEAPVPRDLRDLMASVGLCLPS